MHTFTERLWEKHSLNQCFHKGFALQERCHGDDGSCVVSLQMRLKYFEEFVRKHNELTAEVNVVCLDFLFIRRFYAFTFIWFLNSVRMLRPTCPFSCVISFMFVLFIGCCSVNKCFPQPRRFTFTSPQVFGPFLLLLQANEALSLCCPSLCCGTVVLGSTQGGSGPVLQWTR